MNEAIRSETMAAMSSLNRQLEAMSQLEQNVIGGHNAMGRLRRAVAV